MKDFKIETAKAKYSASEQSESYWIVVVKYKTQGAVTELSDEATFIFKNHANTAVAQKIFAFDKAAI